MEAIVQGRIYSVVYVIPKKKRHKTQQQKNNALRADWKGVSVYYRGLYRGEDI